ncbi:MAG: hypothetical protein WB987_13450 [Candidatus Acidiferrales bacterium]
MAQESNARRLTTHQKAVLIQVLRAFPNERVEILCSAAAEDGMSYAKDFITIFKAIGWDVSGPKTAEPLVNGSGGLALVGSDGSEMPACAEALRDALRIYGIEVETRRGTGGALGRRGFTLWVGPEE